MHERSKEHSENLQKWLHLVEGLKKKCHNWFSESAADEQRDHPLENGAEKTLQLSAIWLK